MFKTTIAAIFTVAIVASCGRVGDSRLNPFNWFSASTPAEIALADGTRSDARPLIGQIDTLSASPTPGGAILRATGIASTQGYYIGQLIPVPTDDPRVLAFEFRAFPPLANRPVSTPRSREVTVAVFLTSRDLAGISELRVSAAGNARAVRR